MDKKIPIFNENWILQVMAHTMTSKMWVWDWYIDNPFVLSNKDFREKKNYLFDNRLAYRIKQLNKILSESDYKTDSISIFLADWNKTFSFIKHESIEKVIMESDFPEDEKTEYLSIIPHEDIMEVVQYFLKNKLVWDMYLSAFREIVKNFDITYCGSLIIKENIKKSKEVVVLWNDEDVSTIKYLLSCPFPIYYQHIHKFDKVLVEDVVVAEECKYFYNEKLPTPQIPILADEVLIWQDNKNIRPSYWQMYTNYNMLWKKTSLITSWRQSGKTYNSIRMAFMRIMLPTKNDVIYLCKTEKQFDQPWNYFEWALKKWQDYWIFELKKWSDEIICTITKNKIKFVSANSSMGTRSYKFNTIIVDEASYIKDDAYYDFLPIAKNNKAEMICNTTISWKAKKESTEWYYNLLSKTEFGMYWDRNFSIRVNIDQVEWLDPIDVADLKEELKGKPERYYCELYAMLPSSNDWIFPEWFFKLWEVNVDLQDRYLIGWDLAKKFDTSWVVVLNQRTWCLVEERRLTNLWYSDQVKIITKMKSFYKAPVVADISNEEWMLEFYPWLIEYPVHFTASKTFNRKLVHWVWRWYIGKESMVTVFMNLAEEWMVRWLMSLVMLQMEAENYKRKVTNSWNGKYEATSGYDDLVSAMLIAVFIYNETYLKQLKIQEKRKKNSIVDKGAVQDHFEKKRKMKRQNKKRSWYYTV